MTKIKLCGLSCFCEIETVNKLQPEYIGFVFAEKSKRFVPPQIAEELKRHLSPAVQAVGVFVNEKAETVAGFLNSGIIDWAQLHGNENEAYIKKLRQLTNKPIIQAFRIETAHDIAEAEGCAADFILLDSGAGTGTAFNWKLIEGIKRPYFLAGGLDADNVKNAITLLHPFAVDVSSGIETDGQKDLRKMAAFVAAVRKEEKS